MLEFEKLAGLTVQTWGNLQYAIARVRTRLKRINEIRASGGELGSLFSTLYIYPQSFYRLALSITAVAGLLAMVGGLLAMFHAGSLAFLHQFFEGHWVLMRAPGHLRWL